MSSSAWTFSRAIDVGGQAAGHDGQRLQHAIDAEPGSSPSAVACRWRSLAPAAAAGRQQAIDDPAGIFGIGRVEFRENGVGRHGEVDPFWRKGLMSDGLAQGSRDPMQIRTDKSRSASGTGYFFPNQGSRPRAVFAGVPSRSS